MSLDSKFKRSTSKETIQSPNSPNPLGILRQFIDWSKKKQKNSTETLKPISNSIPLDQSSVSIQQPNKKPASILYEEEYETLKHLGNGSYSQVKQVTKRIHGGIYAAKIVEKQILSKTDRIALSQEVMILTKMNHPNIMKLHQVIEDDMKCIMIIECLDGGDLFDRVTQKGKLSEMEAQNVLGSLIEAVYYCHSHCIIHRDIKPENILLSSNGIKLCDFGFAKQFHSLNERAIDSCGTPGYAAPEVLNGHSYGFEVDIFSLGVVLYILLCGYPPFPMKLNKLRKHSFQVVFPSKEWNHIPISIKELIKSMLAVDPTMRPTALMLKQHPWIHEGRNPTRSICSEKTMDLHTAFLSKEGIPAMKFGRKGIPHRTWISYCSRCTMIHWKPKDESSWIGKKIFSPRESKMKYEDCMHSMKGIYRRDIHQIIQGTMTPVFERCSHGISMERCCSLVTETRTLDLEFSTKELCDGMIALFTQVVTTSSQEK